MSEETTGPNASGPKLTVGATPSEELIARGLQPEVIDGGRGRKLHLRKPGPLAQFRLIEALGPELAMNQAYVMMVAPLNYLGVIEDAEGSRTVAFSNKVQIEGLIVELGEDGMDALLTWYAINVMDPMNAEMARAKAEHDKALLKNG